MAKILIKGRIRIILHGSWNETLPREEIWGILSRRGIVQKHGWTNSNNTYEMLFGFKTSQARDAAARLIRKWGKQQQEFESSEFRDGVDMFLGAGKSKSK